ncbi:MAG: hypothetical protein JXA82_10315 [Sedimentisphaerales bacterium]|nr:hypothetical protein [Sedimentisphaerales bacterium]
MPYEPYASYMYFVQWEKSSKEWHNVYSLDDGEELQKWHKKQLQTFKMTLTKDDWASIENHRQRSYGRTPFDP